MKEIFNKKRNLIISIIINVVILCVFFYIFYRLIKPTQDDYNFHVYDIYSSSLYSDSFYRYNNLFRYILDLCHLLKFDLRMSASIILSIFMLIRFNFFSFIQNNRNIYIKYSISFLLCFMMPINFGPVEETYIGVFGGNVWHNPTYIAMLAFAPICIYLFFQIYIEKKSTVKNCILLSLFMFLSCFSKPSFVIAFIPACGLYIIIDYFFFHKNVQFLLAIIRKGLLMCAPVIAWLFMSYIFEFTGNNRIVFDFLGVWSCFVKRKLYIPLNIIKTFLVSIIILFADLSNNRKRKIFYLLLVVIGLLYFSLFAETENYYHGNLAWTYLSCVVIFNSFILIDYLNTNVRISKKIMIIIVVVFILQSVSSFRYLHSLINGYIRY